MSTMIMEALQWLRRIGQPARQAALFTPEMLANPYPTYARLRATDPVHVVEGDGRLLLTRYADVVTVLRSPVASSERTRASVRWVPAPLFELRSEAMIGIDGPAHNRLRLLVSKAFTARAVEAMAGRIQGLVDGFLDAVQARPRAVKFLLRVRRLDGGPAFVDEVAESMQFERTGSEN